MEVFGYWWPMVGFGLASFFSVIGFTVFLALLVGAIFPTAFLTKEELEQIDRQREEDNEV